MFKLNEAVEVFAQASDLMLFQSREVHGICAASVRASPHEYSMDRVICASVGYSAFPVSLKVSQIELLRAFKDGTRLVYAYTVFLLTHYETLYGSFIFPSFLSTAGRNNILV